MDVGLFQAKHSRIWRQLESLIRNRQSVRDPETLTSFVGLYRIVSSDLAYAQSCYPNHPVTEYLNQLVATAHHRLYRRTTRSYTTLWSFYIRIFPSAFREMGGYVATAAALSLVGALYGYLLVLFHPLAAYQLLPPSFLHQFQPTTAGPHAVNAPLMSSLIMTHNIVVALTAFVGGLTLGLYTFYALWQNGLMVGVLAALFQSSGRAAVFWSLIVPHGVTELLAIFIAGGAGLCFAHRMVSPGRLSRGAALRRKSVQAVKLMLGTVPMFIIAGTIEGFLTPSPLPIWAKFSVAVGTALMWALYFSLLGRGHRAVGASLPDDR